MNVEEQLKELIIKQYKSIRAFTQSIEVPYSTIDTMLKKGIIGTGIGTMMKVCNALNISADDLVKGRLVSVCIDATDNEYIKIKENASTEISAEAKEVAIAYDNANESSKAAVCKLLDVNRNFSKATNIG